MKKIALILMLVVLVAALAACAQPNDAGQEQQDNSGPTQNVDDQNAQTPDENNQEEQPADVDGTELQSAGGSYNGQVDNNFIEIKVDGVTENDGAQVFMLSEELKSSFESLDLQSGDQVAFTYLVNESGQNLLVTLEKK